MSPRTIDLAGGYVVPPFGEAHNHNVEGRWNSDEVIRTYLDHGVFYVKITNDIADFADEIRPQVNLPTSIDVVFAHGGLTGEGGHPGPLYEQMLRGMRYEPAVGTLPEGWFANRAYFTVDSPEALATVWPILTGRHPDFVKIYLGHSERADREPAPDERRGLAPALVPLVVETAHAAGLTVTAHIETAADFRLAVAAGVDEIAHLPGFFIAGPDDLPDARLTQGDAIAARENNVSVVTTTYLPHASHWEGNNLPLVEDVQKQNLTTLQNAGVRLLVGSDHAPTSRAEAINLHRLGVFDTRTLLTMWAQTTPQSIFPNRRLGRFEAGYEASALVLACDPLESFPCVETIQMRMKQGVVLEPVREPASNPADHPHSTTPQHHPQP